MPAGFKVQPTWKLLTLAQIAEINHEQRDPSPEKRYSFKYVDIESIEPGTGMIKSAKVILSASAPSRARRVVHKGDVIMSTVRPYLKAFAIIPPEFDGEICSTGFAVLTAKEGIDSEFLLYSLFSDAVIRQCNAMMVGGQYPALSSNQVKKIKILVPPLPEQRKIAEILSTVDDAIQKADRAIGHTERLKKGLLREILTSGQKKGWALTRLGELGELQYGYTASAIEEDTGIKFLRVTDVEEGGEIDWLSVPWCQMKTSDMEKYLLKRGDVLFVRIGSTTGKTCYIDTSEKSVFGSYMIRFQPSTASIDTQYFFYFTQSPEYWRQINQNKEGQLKKGVNTKILRNLVVPVPKLHEQREIARILSTVDSRLRFEKARKLRYIRIKNTLLSDLITGKVRHPEFV